MGTINALPYTAVFLTSAPNPDYVFDTVLTGDSDAVFQSATAQDTFVYFSLNNSAKGLAINPFTLEPIPIVISITTSTAADLLTIVDPKIHGFPAPAVLELDLVNATFAAAGDAAVFFVNYTLIDEVTNATASNLITVHYVPTLPTATEAIESANSALSFPSTLDGIEALYVGYFGTPGDLAGIASSLAQIFSGVSLSSLAASFATQAAAIAEYPFLANPQSATPAQINSFIDSVYENLFDRMPTSTEATSAENALSANLSNSQFIDTFIYNTILSAEGQDQPTVENQIGTAELTLYPQDDYAAITRTALPVAQATTIVNEIVASTTTEAQYVNSLLSQVADTTFPAVAVEASMYGVTGSANEITTLVTQVLPAQIATAMQNGYNPVIYASEALGLQFAFADENGGTGFANNFGLSNAAMPATTAGDAAFAAAAASTIFGSAAAANWSGTILAFVANLEALYTANGIPGITNATATEIDLAARGAAWGEAIGIALVNNLGPFGGETANFLENAAQGTAIYSESLSSQPTAGLFQGSSTNPFSPDVPTFPFTNDAQSEVEALYVGYFTRGGDVGGTDYWVSQLNSGNNTIEEEAASYSVQAETVAQYPFLAHPLTATVAQIDSFIASVYQDLFNRAPDAGGEAYWESQLAANLGNPYSVGTFILDVIYGAQNTSAGQDQTTITNKVTVAGFLTEVFAGAGISFSATASPANTLAHNEIAAVTSDPASVSAAEAAILAFVAALPSGVGVTGIASVSHDLLL
jgi:hypothetical protein